MKTIVASIAMLAFTAPAFAGGCGYDATAKMSVKKAQTEQLASANPELLKLVDGKRLALV
ncbi:MAG: hypothetical protein MUC58_00535 [Rhizobiaceae bacterium]|jgi:hypothetical protein|nr:hypothetical protein [Rhizobiaceae bacterium]